ncbi:MAG: mannose-1-phosphate guanylyltransferase [Planctomycetota bacterium]
MRYAMIMAGGAGTRLWPMSRQHLPKQLIPFVSRPGRDTPMSLIEIAAERLEGLVPDDRRFICTGERYRSVIRDRLPAFTDHRILGEPAARDTVNAVGFAAAVFQKMDPDAVFCVLTADHIIEPQDVFAEAMDLGFKLVEDDPSRLVTFSIKPTEPATGFGYVEHGTAIDSLGGAPAKLTKAEGGAFVVQQFKEKPDLATAEQYVASGKFGWNSGMFVFHAGTVMDCLSRFKPESYAGLAKIQAAFGTSDYQRVLDDIYPTLPKISVDYALMEPASTDDNVTICGVDMPVNWLDVGSWPSYADTIAPDASGNRLSGAPASVLTDSRGNLVVSDDPAHTIALLGCEDLIVVRTADATLVMPRDRAQDLKKLHSDVRDDLK